MAGTFPTLSFGSVALYPLQRSLSAGVKITRFLDDTEQRVRTAPFLNSWIVQLGQIKLVDIQAIQAFFGTQKGPFDASWIWPIDGTSWTSTVYQDDSLTCTQTDQGVWTATFNIRQTKKSSTYATGSLSAWPTINGGVRVQLPFTNVSAFLTTKNQMPTGLQYAWTWRASPLMSWPLQYPLTTSTECGALFDAYAKALGAYHTFSFTDPNTGTVYSKCRVGPQPIQRTYKGLNRNTVSLLIEQIA